MDLDLLSCLDHQEVVEFVLFRTPEGMQGEGWGSRVRSFCLSSTNTRPHFAAALPATSKGLVDGQIERRSLEQAQGIDDVALARGVRPNEQSHRAEGYDLGL